MSEDRLERALEGMRNENAGDDQLAGARARVWEKLEKAGVSVCAEIQPGLPEYLDRQLPESRRLLTDDHLSRCPQCRAQLSVLRGERKFEAPHRKVATWGRWVVWGAAAALLAVTVYLGRNRIDTMLAGGGPRATVDSVSGPLYRVGGDSLRAGDSIAESEAIRTGPAAHAVLRLRDGSRLEMNERSELFVRAAWTGQSIRLERGDVIVQAAKQHRGHLRVLTRDTVASVKGTVFAVSAGLTGSVVSVVEGAVAVTQPGVDVLLKPGQQSGSNPAIAHSVREAVAWSPDADSYMALLASFAKLEKDIAALPSPALRTHSGLLESLPPNVVLYGAVPNLGGKIGQALVLADQQSAENPVFRDWWNSSAGQELRQVVERVQSVAPLLGDEVVFGLAQSVRGDLVPMVMSEVQPGKRSALAEQLESLRTAAGNVPAPYSLSDTLLVATDSQVHLEWLLGRLGEGAGTPFASALADRYSRGAGWLLALDVQPGLPAAAGSEAAPAFVGTEQMKHLFLEQRTQEGAEENEITLTFKGPRMGMSSWLASSGSGGAAEYLPSDATFAFYASTREPRQLFDEITAQMLKAAPADAGLLAEAEGKLGANFASNLAAAFGTETAFALEGFSVAGPVWVLTAIVNDGPTVDASIRTLVDAHNAELAAEDTTHRVTLEQETVEGRVWTTLKTSVKMLSATWTYDRGYLVAASDRGAATRAIATRSGGSQLVWSSDFQRQIPSSAGLHPSAFAWLNTKGALQGLEGMIQNSTLRSLLTERDPILVVFSGTTEQIHAASRTRLTGLLIDAMLLESIARPQGGAQEATVQGGRKSGTR
jgi:hypothetical protein